MIWWYAIKLITVQVIASAHPLSYVVLPASCSRYAIFVLNLFHPFYYYYFRTWIGNGEKCCELNIGCMYSAMALLLRLRTWCTSISWMRMCLCFFGRLNTLHAKMLHEEMVRLFGKIFDYANWHLYVVACRTAGKITWWIINYDGYEV